METQNVVEIKQHPREVAESTRIPFPFFRPLSQRKENTWIISIFVILHLISFAATMFVNDCWANSRHLCIFKPLGRFSFQPLSENPLLGPSASGLDAMGALRKRYLVKDHHQLWQIFTSSCLHGGVFHVIISLSSVIFVGIHLEQEFGPWRIGVIYIVSALTGSLVAALFVQDRPSITSSGALFGLLGAMLSGLICNWKVYSKKLESLVAFFVILTLDTVLGLLPHVNNFSNMGGLLSGFLTGCMVVFKPRQGKVVCCEIKGCLVDYDHEKQRQRKDMFERPVLRIVSLVVLSLVVGGVGVAVVQGVNLNEYCSWCHYMDCAPVNWWSCSDEAIACETMTSSEQLTLTCSANGKFKVLGFGNGSVSQERMEDLCYLICS